MFAARPSAPFVGRDWGGARDSAGGWRLARVPSAGQPIYRPPQRSVDRFDTLNAGNAELLVNLGD